VIHSSSEFRREALPTLAVSSVPTALDSVRYGYAPTIRAAFGWNVDYGQLQKIYENDQRGDDAAHR